MPTIQVRDVPDEAYEVIRQRARREGKSIQSYMRQQIIDLACSPSKAEALDRIAAWAAEHDGVDLSGDEIAAYVRADRN